MAFPHAFPIVAHPGPPPEVSARSAQGGWEPYAQAAPADRLLPFVLTRLVAPGQGRWINCATIVHADTEAVIETLLPTGQTFAGPGSLGLVLQKVPDVANQREHFVYTGALIPALSLPCGVPLRLLLDNGWQSPRFLAVAELSGPPDGVSAAYQRLEWAHPGPLSGVPYGEGFAQRLYCLNAGLQFVAPRLVEASSVSASSGQTRLDSVSEYVRRSTNVALAPRYLADAVAHIRAHRYFAVDGERWTFLEAKENEAGADGGRWTMALTLEALEPVQSRLACQPAPLLAVPFDPVLDAPRGWRCGDTSDEAPDYQPTGVSACELAGGANTGYVLAQTQDVNPYSPTYGQAGPPQRTQDLALCPLPGQFLSGYYAESVAKNDCGPGYVGTSVLFEAAAGRFSSSSQADADQQAIAYVQAGAQAYANQMGACQVSMRQISLQNIDWKPKIVSFDIVRTDAVGDVQVTVLAQASTNDGQSVAIRQYTRTFLIPAGDTQLLGVSIPYRGHTLVEPEILEITSTSPADYTF